MSHSRSRRQTLLAIAAVPMLLAGCGSSVPDTVRIGVGTTLSGSSANRGNDILNGVRLAVADLERQGYKVDGRPVRFEVIAVDDKGTAEGAKAAAQKLVDEGVTLVFGHLASDVTLAAVPVYQAKGLPLITTSSAKEITTQGGGNVFRLVASDGMQSKAMLASGQNAVPGGTAAVISEDSVYGRGVLGDLSQHADAAKVKLAWKEAVPPATQDFAALAQRLKADKVVLLYGVLREPQLVALGQALKAVGHPELTVVLSNPAKTDKVAKAELPFKATYVVSSALDVRDFPQGGKFLAAFRETYKSDPVWAAHYAYDGMFAAADAIRRANSVKPEALVKTLKTIDPVTWVTQSMRFGADGEQTNPAIGLYQVRDGAWSLRMSSAAW